MAHCQRWCWITPDQRLQQAYSRPHYLCGLEWHTDDFALRIAPACLLLCFRVQITDRVADFVNLLVRQEFIIEWHAAQMTNDKAANKMAIMIDED